MSEQPTSRHRSQSENVRTGSWVELVCWNFPGLFPSIKVQIAAQKNEWRPRKELAHSFHLFLKKQELDTYISWIWAMLPMLSGIVPWNWFISRSLCIIQWLWRVKKRPHHPTSTQWDVQYLKLSKVVKVRWDCSRQAIVHQKAKQMKWCWRRKEELVCAPQHPKQRDRTSLGVVPGCRGSLGSFPSIDCSKESWCVMRNDEAEYVSTSFLDKARWNPERTAIGVEPDCKCSLESFRSIDCSSYRCAIRIDGKE